MCTKACALQTKKKVSTGSRTPYLPAKSAWPFPLHHDTLHVHPSLKMQLYNPLTIVPSSGPLSLWPSHSFWDPNLIKKCPPVPTIPPSLYHTCHARLARGLLDHAALRGAQLHAIDLCLLLLHRRLQRLQLRTSSPRQSQCSGCHRTAPQLLKDTLGCRLSAVGCRCRLSRSLSKLAKGSRRRRKHGHKMDLLPYYFGSILK